MGAVLLALLSMACAAVNDIVFRLYRRQHRPVGSYLAAIGFVWAGVFSLLAAPKVFWLCDGVTLRWGLASGCLSVVSNILLVHAMARHEAGACATIYRLNLAPAALLAFVLLGEPPSRGRSVGTAWRPAC